MIDGKIFTIAEMKAFMGIFLSMGLMELPKFYDYWARNTIYTLPWFSNTMSKDRFLQILACLHLCNNQEQYSIHDKETNKVWY